MRAVYIRKAKREDSQRVWEIRALPETSRYSKKMTASFKESDKWFQNTYFSNKDNHCFVAVSDKDVIGYCRYDFEPDKDLYIVSVAVDPKHYKQGIANQLLLESRAQLKPKKPLFAQIQKDNTASLKLFQNNGYEIKAEDDKNYYLELT